MSCVSPFSPITCQETSFQIPMRASVSAALTLRNYGTGTCQTLAVRTWLKSGTRRGLVQVSRDQSHCGFLKDNSRTIPPLIQLKAVTKAYGGPAGQPVLDDIDLEVG